MTRTKAEQAAIDRDGETCLRCGCNLYGIKASKHHRKLKSRKVPKCEWDLVENIVILCGDGVTGCHGWAHAERKESEAAGWTVWSWNDPAKKYLITITDPPQMITLFPDGTKIIDSLAGINEGPTPW